MQNRQDESLSDQTSSASEISETIVGYESESDSEIESQPLDLPQENVKPDLWAICATNDEEVLKQALKEYGSFQLYVIVTSKGSHDQSLLHFLAENNNIRLIKIIIETLTIDERAKALNKKDNDNNTVAYKLLASSDPAQINNLLKIILDLYPAKDRFEAFAVVENQNEETILMMLKRRAVEGFEVWNEIFDKFSKIYLVSCGNDDSTRTFLSAFNKMSIEHRIQFLAKYSDLEQDSMKLAFEYYDNFQIDNIELITKWYFLEAKFKFNQTSSNQQEVNYQKIKLILSFLNKEINETDILQQHPEIVSAIQMNLLARFIIDNDVKLVFNAYRIAFGKLYGFLALCENYHDNYINNSDKIALCKKRFAEMTLQIFDELKKTYKNSHVPNSFFKNIRDIYFDITLYCMHISPNNFDAINKTIKLKLTKQNPAAILDVKSSSDSLSDDNLSEDNLSDNNVAPTNLYKYLNHDIDIEIILMKINNNEMSVTRKTTLKSLREKALESFGNSKGKSIDTAKAFNKLDFIVFNILKVAIIYHPGDNENRKQNLHELFNSVEVAYKSCHVAELTVELINQELEKLKQTCQSIADTVSSDHINTSKLSTLGKKSKLAATLDKVIKLFVLIKLSDIEDLTNEQVKVFEKIYRLLDRYPLIYNTLNPFSRENFQSLSSKEKLRVIKNSSHPSVMKAIGLALEFSENCHSQNKELVYQLYKLIDPQIANFTVAPAKIDFIVKWLDNEPQSPPSEKKSDLVTQYADLICYIKMAAFAKSNLILDKSIFTTRNNVLNILSEPHHVDAALINTFNQLDLFICKMLKLYANYDPGNNENRISNKEMLYQALTSAYQAIFDAKLITVAVIDKIHIELKDKCIAIDLNVARHHQQTGLLSKVGKKSSFDKALKKELQESGDNNLATKTNGFSQITNKFKMFRAHEAIPLPHNELSENNLSTSVKYDDITQFNHLINEFNLVLPTKWQAHLTEFTQEAAKLNEQAIKNELTIKKDDKSAEDPSRIESLKHLGYFIVQAKLNLQHSKTDLQSILKELRQYLLQIIVSSRHESFFASKTASALVNFIKNNLDPKISNTTSYESNTTKTYTHAFPR